MVCSHCHLEVSWKAIQVCTFCELTQLHENLPLGSHHNVSPGPSKGPTVANEPFAILGAVHASSSTALAELKMPFHSQFFCLPVKDILPICIIWQEKEKNWCRHTCIQYPNEFSRPSGYGFVHAYRYIGPITLLFSRHKVSNTCIAYSKR